MPDKNCDLEQYLLTSDMSAIHHLARYHWVQDLVPDKGVLLDVACGAGYGSYMIAKNNPDLKVVGVDYDQRAIDIACNTYAAHNLIFQKGDIVKWRFCDGSSLGNYDSIVSFDTIEHILHREIAFINISENLNDDGALFFSTPCGSKEPLLNPAWEHHKIEYNGPYLYNFLSRFFNEVLYPDNNSLPGLRFWNNLNKEKNIYWNRMNPIVARHPKKFGLNL